MPHMISRLIIGLIVLALVPTMATAAPPWTIEEMMSPPYPFGVSARNPVISADGLHVACLWSDTGYGNRDIWTWDSATGEWTRHTDYWTQKAARLRREFERDLNRDREAWEEEHAGDDTESAEDCPEDDAAVDTGEDEAEEFDEEERIEEFEEDLVKQREKFGGVSSVDFLPGSHELLWVFEGRLYTKDLADPGAEIKLRLNHEDGFWVVDTLPDSDAVMLQSDADLYLWWPGNGTIEALTKGGYGDLANNGAHALSRDQRWLAVVVRDYRSVRRTKIPELLAADPHTTDQHFVRPQDTPETVKLKLYDLSAKPPWPVEVELPDEPYFHTENIAWSPIAGDNRLLVCAISGDTQYYRAYLVTPPQADIDDPEVELAYEEHDDRWVNWARTHVAWLCDASLILQSEKDGVAALYELLPPDEVARIEAQRKPDLRSNLEKMCSPEWFGFYTEAGKEPATGDAVTDEEDVASDGEPDDEELEPTLAALPVELFINRHSFPASELINITPLKHSRRVLINRHHPDQSATQVWLYDMDRCVLTPLLSEYGKWYSPHGMNDSETRLAYDVKDERRFSRLGLMDIPLAGGDCLPVESTIILDRDTPEWDAWADTWDVQFFDIAVQEYPEYEEIYRPEDNMTEGEIPVKVWLPPGWTFEQQCPLLIWIHGAGYSSTVKRDPGWTTLFHPWVAEEMGWVVAEFDFRGSKGLGRDWRTDVWGRLGHPETDDLIAVKRHMLAAYNCDPERTAIWGWSYGGFQTLISMGLAPGEFPVGCAVAPVNRWENYNYWYSTCRLGDPAENEEEYDRSAPETYMEHIEGDVLILHGMRDGNTLFQSIAQYLEKGHELGVNIELKLFPSDGHGMGNDQHYVRVYEAVVDYIVDHWPAE